MKFSTAASISGLAIAASSVDAMAIGKLRRAKAASSGFNCGQDQCTFTGTTQYKGYTPRDIAQIWVSATAGMSGAEGGDGGMASCKEAVATAIHECHKATPADGFANTIANWHGIDSVICSKTNANNAGLWQTTSSSGAFDTGCSHYDPSSQDMCANARMAYAMAKEQCAATSYSPGQCYVNGKEQTKIPQCKDSKTPNQPCYYGPFCMNAQVITPYTSAQAKQALPGLNCSVEAVEGHSAGKFSGWGQPYDSYENIFSCLSGACGDNSEPANWNTWMNGQTNAVAEGNLPDSPFSGGRTGKSGNVQGGGSLTAGQLGELACEAVSL